MRLQTYNRYLPPTKYFPCSKIRAISLLAFYLVAHKWQILYKSSIPLKVSADSLGKTWNKIPIKFHSWANHFCIPQKQTVNMSEYSWLIYNSVSKNTFFMDKISQKLNYPASQYFMWNSCRKFHTFLKGRTISYAFAMWQGVFITQECSVGVLFKPWKSILFCIGKTVIQLK